MEFFGERAISLLKSINYIDSSLFGLSIDIFKIRLFINVVQSSEIMKFGFKNDYCDLCADFRLNSNLKFIAEKPIFGPPYLEDGDLAAIDLLDFDFETLDIEKVGKTGRTNQSDTYRELRDMHEVRFTFYEATLQFQFVDLTLSVFDPLDFDKK